MTPFSLYRNSLVSILKSFCRIDKLLALLYALSFFAMIHLSRRLHNENDEGFTLLEILVVVFLIGLVSAIASPKWLSFLESRKLTTINDKVYLGIREAQTEAQVKRTSWQFSVRESLNGIEWAIHPRSTDPRMAAWNSIEDSQLVKFDTETTFDETPEGTKYIVFDERGNTELRYLGRLTFSSENAPIIKRCVIASTVIGALRKSKEQPTPDPNYRRKERFCY